MSELTAFPTNSTLLAQRLQSAEKSIGFIQREHAITLVSLHEEIAKWQQKCSGECYQHPPPYVLHLHCRSYLPISN